MFAIFLRTIQDKKFSIITYSIAGMLMLWMYVGMFPSMQAESAKFNELFKSYPEGVMKALNIEELSFDTIEKFLSIEQFSIVWPLMVMFLCIAFAGGALANEIETGTAEIVLSKPLSRTEIFFGRYFAGLFALAIFTIASIFTIIPLAKLHHVSYILQNHITMALLGFLFAWVILSMSMMFSSIFSERSKVYMCSGAILIVMYVLKIIANLKENYENLQYASFFHYFDYSSAIVHNIISSNTFIVFMSVIVICTSIGIIWFNKRDITI